MSSGYEAVHQRSYNAQVQNIAGEYIFLWCVLSKDIFMNELACNLICLKIEQLLDNGEKCLPSLAGGTERIQSSS